MPQLRSVPRGFGLRADGAPCKPCRTRPARTCACGVLFPRGSQRRKCNNCASYQTRHDRGLALPPPRQFTCAECGKVGETRTRGRSAAVVCSPLCHNRANRRARYQAGSRRRFPHISPKQRRLIFERDGWRCGLCRAVIDPALRWPHPGSASIDHIDPSGAHEPANWQASHLACNVQAGAKRAPVAA
jgi:hypothetical protein